MFMNMTEFSVVQELVPSTRMKDKNFNFVIISSLLKKQLKQQEMTRARDRKAERNRVVNTKVASTIKNPFRCLL